MRETPPVALASAGAFFYPRSVRTYRLSDSGRVAVEEPSGWRVVGRVEPVGSGWLALDSQDRRLYGDSGPVWPSRAAAAQAVAEVG